MMFEVIITYDYKTPPTPQDYIVILKGAGYPKTNYKIVAHAETQDEGEQIGYDAFIKELEALSWLLNDPVLHELEIDEKSDRKDIYRWHDTMEQEYQSRLATHRAEYAAKVEARRAELIAKHMPESKQD